MIRPDAILREQMGTYGSMRFVRETPLRFIPVRQATFTIHSHGSPPPVAAVTEAAAPTAASNNSRVG